jgi:hypothetical protein
VVKSEKAMMKDFENEDLFEKIVHPDGKVEMRSRTK